MSTDVRRPAWLKIAQQQLATRARPKVEDCWPRLPLPGEIHIAEVMGGQEAEPRMVCVLAVEPTKGWAEVALVSPEVDLGTDRDLPLSALATGLPFELMVETDVVAKLWLIQLGRVVVRLDSDRTDSIFHAVRGEGALGSCVALPIQGPADPRSVFKEEERVALGALARDCNSQLASGWRAPVVVDPAVLVGADHSAVGEQRKRLVAVAERLLDAESRMVPDPSFDLLAILGVSDCDTLQALAPLLEAALREPDPGATDALRFDPPREFEADPEDELGALLPPLIESEARSILVLTTRNAWSDPVRAPMSMATAASDEAGPVQIVRLDVEEAW
jgi:hypothetical protein